MDNIVTILPETAPALYLEYLQKKGISYLFAGTKGDDLRSAMQTLAETFGVESLSLQGGGIIDGAFLQAGLIDELSLAAFSTGTFLRLIPCRRVNALANVGNHPCFLDTQNIANQRKKNLVRWRFSLHLLEHRKRSYSAFLRPAGK